jgi:hypothetical protein
MEHTADEFFLPPLLSNKPGTEVASARLNITNGKTARKISHQLKWKYFKYSITLPFWGM